MNTNDRLNAIHAARTSTRIADKGDRIIEANAQLVAKDSAATSLDTYQPVSLSAVSSLADGGKGGLIGRLMSIPIRKQQREDIARVTHQTTIALMEDRATGIKRESHAYWQARSVQIAETMEEYLRQHLRGIEIERMEHIIQSLEQASITFNTKLEEIEARPLPDLIKDKLITASFAQYERTCQRIQDDAIMQKYPAKQL